MQPKKQPTTHRATAHRISSYTTRRGLAPINECPTSATTAKVERGKAGSTVDAATEFKGDVMDAIEFAKLVQQMRDAQKRYFAHRDNLDDCKKLERIVDQCAKQIVEPKQPTLFGE